MSQTIYLRHHETGDIQSLVDPKSAQLIPLMNAGYLQVDETLAKKEIATKEAGEAQAVKPPSDLKGVA